jgi:hypothetical protein
MRPCLSRLFAAASVAALFLAAAPRASADTITLTFTGTSGASNVSYSLTGSSNTSATPGPYFWTASPLPAGMTNPISTFCIELTQNIPGGGNVYTVNTDLSASPTIGTTAKANAIEALFGDKGSTSNSAFQLALWELIYDGTSDIANPTNSNFFATGNFKSWDPSAAAAQTLLHTALNNVDAGITNFDTNYAGYELVALSSPYSQDQLFLEKVQPKFPPGVPAPPAVVLAGIGLLAMGGRSRWYRRTPNAA